MALDRTARVKDSFDVSELELQMDQNQMPEFIRDSDEWVLDLERQNFSNDSFYFVNEVLGGQKELVDTYSALALASLEELGDFPENQAEDSNIRLNMPDAPSIESVQVVKPSRPTYDTPDIGAAPGLRGDIQTPSFNPVTRPDIVYPDPPAEENLNWSEDPYLSALLTNLTNAVNDIVVNGGTGLSAEFEAAVYARAASRLQLDHEAKYNEAMDFYGSKSHPAPPGALVSRLTSINEQHTEQLSLISSDIAAKQLELAHEHKKFNLDLAQRIEAMNMQNKSEVENRALDAAKATVGLLYEGYKVAMEGLMTKVEVYKTDVQAEGMRVEALVSGNKGLTDTLVAETQAWSARIEAEFGLVEQIIRMYVAEIGGYSAEVSAGAEELRAIIERYKAMVGAEEVQGQISLGEYEQYVKYVLGEIQLKLSSQQEAGRIAAQIAASALSSFNASASVSDGSSRSKSYGEQKSMSSTNSLTRQLVNSMSMGWSMAEDAQDSYSESQQFEYGG